MKYEILMDNSIAGLTREVSSALKLGWELYGAPFMFHTNMCQAVVKRDPPKKRPSVDEALDAALKRIYKMHNGSLQAFFDSVTNSENPT